MFQWEAKHRELSIFFSFWDENNNNNNNNSIYILKVLVLLKAWLPLSVFGDAQEACHQQDWAKDR